MGAAQPTEIFSGDDDDFVAAMDADALWSFATDTPDEFAETRFGVLKLPLAR
jgi:hypothetical protein